MNRTSRTRSSAAGSRRESRRRRCTGWWPESFTVWSTGANPPRWGTRWRTFSARGSSVSPAVIPTATTPSISPEFLKSQLDLARDVVEAERTVQPATSEERGRHALTELFEGARNDRTSTVVERVVNDIDEIVRHVRFAGWQSTHSGERQVKQALRKTLLKYRLHQDQELLDGAYTATLLSHIFQHHSSI